MQAGALLTRIAEAGQLCPGAYLRGLIASNAAASNAVCLDHLRHLHPQLHLPTLLAVPVDQGPGTPEREEAGSQQRPAHWPAARVQYANARRMTLQQRSAHLPVAQAVPLPRPTCNQIV